MNKYQKAFEKVKEACANFDTVDELITLKELVDKSTQFEWIPCSKRLPEEPKENPEFDGKPLELYLVTFGDTEYPFRAIWNGKFFADGFSMVDVIAWMPLPEPYKGVEQ